MACNNVRQSKEAIKQPVIDYYKLLQGPWESTGHKIYRIKGNRYLVFEYKSFDSGKYELNFDTLYMQTLLGYNGKGIIKNITEDSLVIMKLEDKSMVRCYRPTREALKKDTITVKPDSVISKKEVKVFENEFVFSVLADYDQHHFLKIQLKDCKDSCTKLVHDIWFKGGDCNSNMETTTAYELIKDRLIFYTEEDFTEHFDDMHPHSSESYKIETYVIRKNGDIVRIKTESSENNPDLAKEVSKRLVKVVDNIN